MPITLSEGQRELIVDEAGRFAAQLQNPAARQVYQDLAEEAKQNRVSDELARALGDLLRLGLGSGRIRSLHGAHAEMEATRLFARTPQGEALNARFEEAGKALEALAGQRIEKVSLSARGPGMYTLTITTDEARVVASLDESGVEVRSVEVTG